MKKLFLVLPVVAAISCSSQQTTEAPEVPDSIPVPEPTSVTAGISPTETALIDSINAFRKESKRGPLKQSSALSRLAQIEADRHGREDTGLINQTALQKKSGYRSLGILTGSLTDRGPKTGSNFIDYWKETDANVLLGFHDSIGVGIAKDANGNLRAVTLFGGDVGSRLITPLDRIVE